MSEDKIKELENRSWDAMLKLLDKEMPREKKRRGLFWIWMSAASGVAAALILYSLPQNGAITLPSTEATILAEAEATPSFEESTDSKTAPLSTVASSNPEMAYVDVRSSGKSSNSLKQQVRTNKSHKALTPKEGGQNPATSTSSFSAKATAQPTHVSDSQANQEADAGTQMMASKTTNKEMSLASLPYKSGITSMTEIPEPLEINSLTPILIEPVNPERIHGFSLANKTLASLNTSGLWESGVQLSYDLKLNQKFVFQTGLGLSATNLSLSYFDPQTYPAFSTNKLNESFSNVAYDSNQLSSSVSQNQLKSNLNWTAFAGLSYFINQRWSIHSQAGVRNYQNIDLGSTKDFVASDSGTNTPGLVANSSRDLKMKMHYFQNVGIAFALGKKWEISAEYMLTGQPFNTGFYISKNVDRVNHFAGLGLKLKL